MQFYFILFIDTDNGVKLDFGVKLWQTRGEKKEQDDFQIVWYGTLSTRAVLDGTGKEFVKLTF